MATTAAQKEQWTIKRLLEWTAEHFTKAGLDQARLRAELLLAHVLACQRIDLYVRFDFCPEPESLARFRELVKRAAAYEPVAYLTGEREFWSLSFEVSDAVLVPRPDSERVIEIALARAPRAKRIVDVGTGSGCLALSLAKERPGAVVTALDVSPDACAMARKNAERLGLAERVSVVESDLLSALEARDVDLLVANLPYIPSADMAGLMPDVRLFEPHLALDGGPDGLVLIRRLVAAASAYMVDGGVIVLEADPAQLEAIGGLLTSASFTDVQIDHDLGGHARVVSAIAPMRT